MRLCQLQSVDYKVCQRSLHSSHTIPFLTVFSAFSMYILFPWVCPHTYGSVVTSNLGWQCLTHLTWCSWFVPGICHTMKSRKDKFVSFHFKCMDRDQLYLSTCTYKIMKRVNLLINPYNRLFHLDNST